MQQVILFLGGLINKKCNIRITGFIQINITIEELKYELKNDVLEMRDKRGSNYIKININQIYNINKTQKIELFLDNDTVITIDKY
ncbi:MAG: hypothetical protein Q4G05_03380 [Clostridia bacterium]|nr:hypothetical protein [Clostridia bacterium]